MAGEQIPKTHSFGTPQQQYSEFPQQQVWHP
jgi:hypothetical protein